MIFPPNEENAVYVARSDVFNPLASWSKHGFDLDGAHWPSAEHYYQGMKFDDLEVRETVANAPHPKAARKLAKQHKAKMRKDWKAVKITIMTRGIYIKCMTHPQVADALLKTGDARLVESSQYDYFWGCGRDFRGENHYGRILMQVRDKIRRM